MLVTLDKRGSIILPASLRKELRLEQGSCLDLDVQEGGVITLSPVAVYPGVHLSKEGLEKLAEARESGTAEPPEWLKKGVEDARADLHRKVR